MATAAKKSRKILTFVTGNAKKLEEVGVILESFCEVCDECEWVLAVSDPA